MYIGIMSDVFDGIVARKLKISTDKLRVQDTIIDLFFYVSILYFLILSEPQLFRENKFILISILCLECLMYCLSLVRFKKIPSPHAIMSKFWGIYIVIEFTLILQEINGTHFAIALYIGLIVHLDRVLIYLLLKKWEHDIPSSYHAYLLRKGLKIRKMELFNG
jgi:CDP-diacylglycerol--glycerol-3-phosphate 3-phosphatidyltransferase